MERCFAICNNCLTVQDVSRADINTNMTCPACGHNGFSFSSTLPKREKGKKERKK